MEINNNSEKKHKGSMRRGNREIMLITYVFVAVFVGLIIYLLCYTQFQSSDIINNTYNKRQDLYAKKVVRGDILSRDGQILATTLTDEYGLEERVYPFGNVFAHAVGFSTHGKTGIESFANLSLLTSDIYIGERIKNDFNGVKNPGNKVVTTLNVYMQQVADASLSGKRGAVIATNASTGEILALVSKPDFDPNTVALNWSTINDENNTVLLNRVTSGLYPPGSTFKIVTALEYIKENPDMEGYHFDCNGSYTYEGNTINCYHGQKHGELDFTKSFAKSCNSSFANIATTLNKREFGKTCNDLLFGQSLPIPYSYKESQVVLDKNTNTADVLQTAIGQGKTQITPFHMNLITQAIFNNGILMNPYVVLETRTANNDLLKTTEPSAYTRLLSVSDSLALKDLMEEVVTVGTATKLRDTYGYKAYGKTGSAEYSSDKSASHAWFTGCGINENNDLITVTVIVEGGGSGGEVAVPIAKNVLDAYFGSID